MANLIKVSSAVIVSELSSYYSRNNRSTGHKSLRCFPSCTDKGHSQGSFCGKPLCVEITIDINSETEFLSILSCMHVVMDLRVSTGVSRLITASSVLRNFGISNIEVSPTQFEEISQSKSYHLGSMSLIPEKSTSYRKVFLATFNSRLSSWDYSWKSNRWSNDSHVVDVFVLQKVDGSSQIGPYNNLQSDSQDFLSSRGEVISHESLSCNSVSPIVNISSSHYADDTADQRNSLEVNGPNKAKDNIPDVKYVVVGHVVSKEFRIVSSHKQPVAGTRKKTHSQQLHESKIDQQCTDAAEILATMVSKSPLLVEGSDAFESDLEHPISDAIANSDRGSTSAVTAASNISPGEDLLCEPTAAKRKQESQVVFGRYSPVEEFDLSPEEMEEFKALMSRWNDRRKQTRQVFQTRDEEPISFASTFRSALRHSNSDMAEVVSDFTQPTSHVAPFARFENNTRNSDNENIAQPIEPSFGSETAPSVGNSKANVEESSLL